MQNPDSENKRRSFLKILLASAACVAPLSLISGKTKAESNEKIKLLTPDGKLVEIDKSQIEKEITPKRASNKEVLDWMKVNKNNKA